MLRKLFIFITLLLIGAEIGSAQAQFSVSNPGTQIQGRRFALTFQLKNGQGNPPQAPQLTGCKLLYGPSVSTMQSTQIINGRAESSSRVDYTFTYLAEKAGKVQVPAMQISVDGKVLKSSPTTFEILPPDKNAPVSQGGQGGSGTRIDDISTQTPGEVSKDDFFVRIELSRTSVYEQEPIVCTIYIYTKLNIVSFLIKTQPSFDGFLSEELDVASGAETVHYNGQNYYRAMLKRSIIYPQKSGTLKITSGLYDVTVRQYQRVSQGFWVTNQPVDRQLTTASNSATVSVKALPEPKPAGFNGAVGRYKASTTLAPERLLTNEAATLSYIVSGSGNIKYLREPDIAFPPGFEEYTPKVDIDARYSDGNMHGTYRVDYTVVPQEQGKYQIAVPAFVYFNPSSQQYETIDLSGYDVNVGRGVGAPSTGVEQNQIAGGMKDILYIKTQHVAQQRSHSSIFTTWWYWVLWGVLLLCLIAAILLYQKELRMRADVQGRKLARANKVARKRLKKAHAYMKQGKTDEFYQALAAALWGFMSDKLGIPASQLTRDNIQSTLESRGVNADRTREVLDILDECEMARFTPHTTDQVSDMYRQAVNAIKNLSV